MPASIDPFALPAHGGDLLQATDRFGDPKDGWLDLSTGINPFSYPLPPLPDGCWTRLPDRIAEFALRRVAATAFGASDPDQLVTVPGSQAMIQLLPKLRPMSRVAILEPTYGEHQICWEAAGHQILPCETLDRIGDADVVVLTNPNNPDGRRHDPTRLLELATRLSQKGGVLIVDEAYGDVAPEISLVPRLRSGLIVLRSFGKFFGLAGVRLGFAIADPSMARQMRAQAGPWAVCGPALAIGLQALADDSWITAMRQKLVMESRELADLLRQSGLTLVGGTPLFQLVNAGRAWALYEYLGQQGILVRAFPAAPRWLRFGLPGSTADRERLRKALNGWNSQRG